MCECLFVVVKCIFLSSFHHNIILVIWFVPSSQSPKCHTVQAVKSTTQVPKRSTQKKKNISTSKNKIKPNVLMPSSHPSEHIQSYVYWNVMYVCSVCVYVCLYLQIFIYFNKCTKHSYTHSLPSIWVSFYVCLSVCTATFSAYKRPAGRSSVGRGLFCGRNSFVCSVGPCRCRCLLFFFVRVFVIGHFCFYLFCSFALWSKVEFSFLSSVLVLYKTLLSTIKNNSHIKHVLTYYTHTHTHKKNWNEIEIPCSF